VHHIWKYAASNRRREKMANVAAQGGKWIRQDKRLAIYLRDGCSCVYCGHAQDEGATLTLDHVTAQSLGGTNKETNLVTACLSCNSSKGKLTVKEFVVYLQDKGIDAQELPKKIRRHTRRSIKTLRKQAKAIIARR
jgi:5-methylcytosine-specific restriction endonuclease McrA